MEAQRERARAAGKFSLKDSVDLTWIVLEKDKVSSFAGYDTYTTESLLLKYAVDDSHTYFVFDKTPFYAESGGQVGDKGYLILYKHSIKTDARINVLDTKKIGEDIVHIVEGSVLEGNTKPITATLEVQQSIRRDTARNHTATHLLHAELRSILGDHVHQAGSYVGPDRLRFDFTHFEKVSVIQQIDIQQRINTRIMQNMTVHTVVKPYAEAIRNGAQALFGEKYGDEVRVVTIKGASQELCGGTHVERSGDIGLFIIISESSVASGVRRIEAITGTTALDVFKTQQTVLFGLRDAIKHPEDEILERVISMNAYVRNLEKENSELKSKLLTLDIEPYFQNERKFEDKSLFVNRVNVENMDQLKALGDKVREKMKSGIAIFGSVINNTPQVLCVVTDDLVKEGIKAGNIVKSLGKAMGGGGGGKPHMATAGGKDVDGLDHVLKNIESLIV